MRTQNNVSDAVEGLIRSVTSLVESVHGAVSNGRSAPRGPVSRPGRPAKVASTQESDSKSDRLRKSLRNYWANLTPRQKKARVDAILRGRGLLPKRK